MYNVFNTYNGVARNPFAGKSYFDVALTVGRRKVNVGFIPEKHLVSFLADTAVYEEDRAMEGYTNEQISAHLQTLEDSPSLNMGVDSAGRLVFYRESVAVAGSSTFKTFSSNPWLAHFNRFRKEMDRQHLFVGYSDYPMCPTFDTSDMGKVAAIFGAVTNLRSSAEPFIGCVPVFVFSNTTRNGSGYPMPVRIYVEAISSDYANDVYSAAGVNSSNDVVYIMKDLAGSSQTYNTPHEDIFNIQQQALIDSIDSSKLLLIANAFRVTQHPNIASLTTEILGQSQYTNLTKNLMIDLGQVRMIGRPPGLTSMSVRFEFSALQYDATTGFYVEKDCLTLAVEHDRRITLKVLDEMSVSPKLSTEAKEKALTAYSKVAESSTSIKTVLYKNKIDVATAIEDSEMRRLFAAARSFRGENPDIMLEDFTPTMTYKQLSTRLKAKGSVDIMSHFILDGNDVPYTVAADSPLGVVGRAMLKVTFIRDTTSLEITSWSAAELDGTPINEDVAKKAALKSNVYALFVTQTGESIEKDEISAFWYGRENWAQLIEDAGEYSGVSHTSFIFDSAYDTVQGFPDVFKVDHLVRHNTMMVYAGLSEGAIEGVVHMSLMLAPTREIVAAQNAASEARMNQP